MKSYVRMKVVCSITLRIILILFLPFFSYSQTFFGVSSAPADNGAQAGAIVAVAPPASMVAGDLVIIHSEYRANTITLSMSATGGQTWNTATNYTPGLTNQSTFISWCRYNGTWAANPSVTAGGGNTLGLTVVMYVYRPVNSNSSWGVNITPTNSTSATAINTITGITTTAPNTVTMAFWSCGATNTWGTLTGAGWSKTGLSAQYRNTTTGQSHTAAYNINTTAGAIANVSQTESAATNSLRTIMAWHELNDFCASAPVLTSGTTCTNTPGTLQNATISAPAVPTGCATAGGDVWYQFTAQTAYPVITISSIVTATNANPRIQLLHGSCGALVNDGCVSGTSVASLALDTRSTPGGAGLTVGATYFVRIYSNTIAPAGANWNFNICITDPAPGRVDYSSSYVNITKGSGGGTVAPGDTLEIRTTFAIFSGAMDSLAFYDTLTHTKGLSLVPNSISIRTNEDKLYKSFTDVLDADAGWRVVTGSDTAIQINMGPNATSTVRGKLRSTSKPSFYGGTCIVMATYKAVVYAGYNTKINYKGGAITYRDTATGIYTKYNFNRDTLIVYQSPGLCPNAVAVSNAIGVETNGTFGVPSGGAPLARNRGASAYTNYTYNIFSSAGGPQDYFYGVANNTSAKFTILQNWGKSDVSSPSYRVFTLWDIIGDHTGAANTAKGNPPCDTTQPVSSTNPCGYMLVINSSYKTDTAFQYTVSNLCPNSYYEISAWIRNICYKCGCDSNGVGALSAGYIPFATGDSSGVQPNLSFQVNSIDYFTTGNIPYYGTTPTKSDTSNKWVKRGFTYLTGPSESSFILTIRNNAPGGGGNDWAMDDITVSTCLPNMNYSPSTNPNVCDSNILVITDTIQSYFNNYTYYKWQRSTDGGTTWTDVTGALGPATPVWNGSAWQYVTTFTIPGNWTYFSNNGDKYRVVVATTSSNISNANCQFTDGISIITLHVIDCQGVLKVDLLSFNAKLTGDHASLNWSTSREDEPVHFILERSTDGINFTDIGNVPGNSNNGEVNYYSFTDPDLFTGKAFYRVIMINKSSIKKYSRIIQLSRDAADFDLMNVNNPFKNDLAFNIVTNKNASINVQLIDGFGRIVENCNLLVYAGVNSLSVKNTSGLPSGMYILQVANKEMVINRKVLKQ